MSTILPLFKTSSDTRRIILQIKSKEFPLGINIAGWSGFIMNIDPVEFPTNTLNNVGNLVGSVEDSATGQVSFSPSGTILAGDYFYNAKAIDDNGELTTFSKGTFKVTREI